MKPKVRFSYLKESGGHHFAILEAKHRRGYPLFLVVLIAKTHVKRRQKSS